MLRRAALTPILLLPVVLLAPEAAQGQSAPITGDDLAAFAPRHIGPAVTGGRIHDVEALPDDPSTLYVATASGGLWRSTDRGITWTPLWEDMPTSTFGDIDISRSDPNVIYAGTGEQQNRQSSSWGNGVYRSDDGGDTWTHLGLEETRHTGRVRVHPTNPDIAYVAALGNLWAPGPDRGVYRTRDRGRTWEKVLYVDEHTGAVDLVLDPSDPDVLYAATYQRRRRTWGFSGGGPGSGIHKTTDGGDTWEELTNGLPSGDKGRIGLAIAESDPRVLNALVQHGSESGVYRTEDAGANWTKVNDRNVRPMYYSHIFIDPTDENRVYTLATTSFTSADGGRTWEEIAVRPTYDVGVHADHHSLWIDPNDPEHLYLAGDAGLHESYDRGVDFRRIDNLPIGQFYGIGVDTRDPYSVYGGMQDNHSWMGPSRTRSWEGIVPHEWRQIGYGDGMYMQVDTSDNRTIYVNAQNGSWTRFDNVTGDMIDLELTAPEGEPEYRFDWVSPSLISRHDPDVIYLGGNRLFVSRDRGVSFTRSPDLTRQIDRDTVRIMGVRGTDVTLSPNDGTSSFGEITTIGESGFDPAVLWVGTDDGNVQVTRDGTATWTEVGGNVEGVRDGTYVSRVTPSNRGPGSAYVAFDAHRDGDFGPYLFRTDDFGTTWVALHGGLPSGSVNDVVEHPDNPDVLFVGTEHHLFVSTDAGATWARHPGLPTTHYDDLLVHPTEGDLVLGTHGRSIIVLDDVGPLAGWSADAHRAPAWLFATRPARLLAYWKDTSYRAQAEWFGQNPPDGALITYRLGSGGGDAVLQIRNAAGESVRTLDVPSSPGLHRVNWDLRHGASDRPEPWAPGAADGGARPLGDRGPLVSPGLYTLELEARGVTVDGVLRVDADPDLSLTRSDYLEREAFLLEVLDLREEIAGRARNASGPQARALDDLREVTEDLYDALNGGGVRQGTLHPPTRTQRDALDAARRRLADLAGN